MVALYLNEICSVGLGKHSVVCALPSPDPLPSSVWQGMLHHRELWNLYWEGLHCLALNCFV